VLDSVFGTSDQEFWRERKPFLNSDMQVDFYNRWHGLGNLTMITGCGVRRRVGVICNDFCLKNFGHIFNDTACKYMLSPILMNLLL
jgi:hypothetical protein